MQQSSSIPVNARLLFRGSIITMYRSGACVSTFVAARAAPGCHSVTGDAEVASEGFDSLGRFTSLIRIRSAVKKERVVGCERYEYANYRDKVIPCSLVFYQAAQGKRTWTEEVSDNERISNIKCVWNRLKKRNR